MFADALELQLMRKLVLSDLLQAWESVKAEIFEVVKDVDSGNLFCLMAIFIYSRVADSR